MGHAISSLVLDISIFIPFHCVICLIENHIFQEVRIEVDGIRIGREDSLQTMASHDDSFRHFIFF